MRRYDRGAFLERGGRAALAAGAIAAGLEDLVWAGAGPARDPALAELAKKLSGPVVSPSSRDYDQARLLFNTRFDSVTPRGIAYCESTGDVQRAIAWARQHGVRVAVRAGGHGYGGYSTTEGLVLDVSRLDRIEVDAAARTSFVGAGSLLIDVYSKLAAHGVTIPAGSCPTVGVAGLALGGGIGFSSRKLGLTCDSIRALRIVTADGRALVCDAKRNADLFWACRGGGGGNFGVVTSFLFRTHPIGSVSYFTIDWPWEHARAVVGAWQAWAPHAPDELFSVCSLRATAAGPRISVSGQHFGSKQSLLALLKPIRGAAPTARVQVGAGPFMKAVKIWAGCTGTVDECHLEGSSPEGTLQRWTFKGKSDYVDRALPAAAVDRIVRAIEARQAQPRLGRASILLDAHGGAINRVPAAATAFVHRDTLFSCQYLAFWGDRDPGQVASANLAWLTRLYADLRPFVSGAAYQNYADPQLGNWRSAYYGRNLPRLVAIKRRYDPRSFFRFPQGIPTRL